MILEIDEILTSSPELHVILPEKNPFDEKETFGRNQSEETLEEKNNKVLDLTKTKTRLTISFVDLVAILDILHFGRWLQLDDWWFLLKAKSTFQLKGDSAYETERTVLGRIPYFDRQKVNTSQNSKATH